MDLIFEVILEAFVPRIFLLNLHLLVKANLAVDVWVIFVIW